MENETVFADGLIVKKPHENAPDFIKLELSFKADEFIAFLQKNKKSDGWVNCDLKKSKAGKLYVSLNTYVPNTQNVPNPAQPAQEELQEDDLPF